MHIYKLTITCYNRECDYGENDTMWEEDTFFASLPKAQNEAYGRAASICPSILDWDTHTDLSYLSMSHFDGTCYEYWITIHQVAVVD